MNDTKSKSSQKTDEKAEKLHLYVTTTLENDENYVYNVPSSGHDKSYNVTQFRTPDIGDNEWICECMGFKYNGHKSLNFYCSHIKAVHLALENGIITHTHSTKDTTMSNPTNHIEEARITGQFDSNVMEQLLRLHEGEAATTDITITMRIPASDFRLRETTFSCLAGLSGTVVVRPSETDISVQRNAERVHESTLPPDQTDIPMPDRELVPSVDSDNSLPF